MRKKYILIFGALIFMPIQSLGSQTVQEVIERAVTHADHQTLLELTRSGINLRDPRPLQDRDTPLHRGFFSPLPSACHSVTASLVEVASGATYENQIGATLSLATVLATIKLLKSSGAYVEATYENVSPDSIEKGRLPIHGNCFVTISIYRTFVSLSAKRKSRWQILMDAIKELWQPKTPLSVLAYRIGFSRED